MERVKLKPILLNNEMVRVILKDGEMAIRRVLKQQPPKEEKGMYEQMDDGSYQFKVVPYKSIYDYEVKPPYQIGNIFYAKEMWAKTSNWVDTDPDVGIPDGFIYKADWENKTEAPKWRSLISMPKEAARIFLRVSDFRVEKLQDIDRYYESDYELDKWWGDIHRVMYSKVWDSIIKKTDLDKYGWNANPWVTTTKFERISKEEAYETEKRA